MSNTTLNNFAVSEIKRLEKENARLSQRLKLAQSDLRVSKRNQAFWAEHLRARNEEVDQLKKRIAELEK